MFLVSCAKQTAGVMVGLSETKGEEGGNYDHNRQFSQKRKKDIIIITTKKGKQLFMICGKLFLDAQASLAPTHVSP